MAKNGKTATVAAPKTAPSKKAAVLNQAQQATQVQRVLALAKEHGVEIVDFKFTDLPGTWQHFSITIDELDEKLFTRGIGFDGSSIRGFQEIDESDMLLVPDPTTAILDPVTAAPTLSLVCSVVDPITLEPYSRDPRYVARKAEAYLQNTGVADISYWGPEAEFFVFDHVEFDQTANAAHYKIDSEEGIWNSGSAWNGKPNLGYRPRHKEGYFPVAPYDSLQDFRTEAVLRMRKAGIHIEVHHHEVATAGQCEIDMRYGPLVKMADNMLLYKYILRNVGKAFGKTVTFMPKPLFGDNGSGMHVHQSLWKKGDNLFVDEKGYAGLSQQALWYIGGLLKHSPALLAICAPTTNSYRRLVPGYEAPVNLVYSKRNRSAAVRIPMYSNAPAAKRIEFRPPDPSANPYLAFAALLMAGLDGIENEIDPGKPMDTNLYDLPPAQLKKVPTVPGSLDQSLEALEKDHDFLLKGGVFTTDLLEAWFTLKRKEADAVRLRPHPYEFFQYYDA